jgi:phage/plasmid-associated DNA primase
MRSSAGTKYFEDIDKINEIRFALKSKTKEEVISQHSVTPDVISDIEGTHDENQFWAINSKGTVIIIPIFFKTFLERRGYFKYYPETAVKPTFVKVKSNIVTITSVEIIKDDVLNYLINEPDVWNHVSKSKQLFSEQFLTMLKSIDMEMIKDTKSTAYVPFLNGVVKITSKSIELQKYISCDGFIWDNQIIKRNYIQAPIDNNFQDLVHKVSNNDKSRIQALESTLGYLIHSYKDKQHQKAVIVNDELISDNPNGGSGKSIMINALKHFRKVVIIDGKAFDPNKGDFIYQRVDLDTQILAFDDVKKSFNFEAIFSLITEGITVNRKNKDEIFIPFERAPKVIITTNYVINGSGSSHARRRHEIEFHQYFNESRNPMDVYGRLLFDSWDADDWASFDCYMLSNLQNYLSTGLQSVKSINSEAKRVIQSTSKDFYDWAMEYEWSDTRHYIAVMLSSFIEASANNHVAPKRFAQWVRLYLGYKSFTFTEGRGQSGIFVHIQVPF